MSACLCLLVYAQYIPGVRLQVVIAGASEAGLACLEHLLMQPHMHFTSLMLLAPGGVTVGGAAARMSASRLATLGLHANVTLVDSHMVALAPQDKVLLLADRGQLPYDCLAVTTGLQVGCKVPRTPGAHCCSVGDICFDIGLP